MLAAVSFLVGEKLQGSSLLFDSQNNWPGHHSFGPGACWVFVMLTIPIGAAEEYLGTVGWVQSNNVPVDRPGLLRCEYVPGDIGFDPLGLKPKDEEELMIVQSKKLQNGRLAMLPATGFRAQKMVDEHFMA